MKRNQAIFIYYTLMRTLAQIKYSQVFRLWYYKFYMLRLFK